MHTGGLGDLLLHFVLLGCYPPPVSLKILLEGAVRILGVVLGLLGGILDVLINIVHKGVQLLKIVSDLLLDDFCDDRLHHPQQQRLGNVKE